jgi:hypothetical protein
MTKNTPFSIAPGAILLVLLATLTLLAVQKRLTTAEETEKAAVKVEVNVVRDSYSKVVVIALVALFAYVIWIVLRASPGEAQSTPPAKESSAAKVQDNSRSP